MAKAVLFDLDGVLVDTFDVWGALLTDVAHRLGYPPISLEAYRAAWGQGIEEDVRKFYPNNTIDDIKRMYDAHYGDHLDKLKVMPGAPEALAALRLPKAVVTNSPVSLATRALAIAKLDGFFDAVIGCDLVAHSKPAPDEVFEACKRLGVQPGEVIVVGDSKFDEGAAKAAGAGFVWFRSFAELKLDTV